MGTRSTATGLVYPTEMVLRACGVARSSFYSWRRSRPPLLGKRGPKAAISDQQLLVGIRRVLSDSQFHGEGYRKVWARLGLKVGRNRVLRLMRQHNLLAPTRIRHQHGPKAHDRSIRTAQPNQIWGTDGTRFETEEDGWVWFFAAIDHCAQDIVGWHVTKVGDRFAALEPVRQGVSRHFAQIGADVARGLSLRHDHGSQYMSRDFLGEVKFLGIRSTPTFVGEPQGNGIAERFMRTLREQCLYRQRFHDVAQAREVIGRFIEAYNADWLLQRHGHRTPNQVRASFVSSPAA